MVTVLLVIDAGCWFNMLIAGYCLLLVIACVDGGYETSGNKCSTMSALPGLAMSRSQSHLQILGI